METTGIIHITTVHADGAVWGHETRHCDPGGCAAGADRYYAHLTAADVEVGHVYEVDTGGIIAEIE